ncbi:MAG: type II toxin-antitoxin system HicA family toxin [Anaerolineae bacterium]|nr:type II toxin-antitoxin system HicA family toxin [Anaerolineae bacterium]
MRQKGSHIIMDNGQGRVVVVPNHREIARGTLRSIIALSGLTEEEFLELLKG